MWMTRIMAKAAEKAHKRANEVCVRKLIKSVQDL